MKKRDKLQNFKFYQFWSLFARIFQYIVVFIDQFKNGVLETDIMFEVYSILTKRLLVSSFVALFFFVLLLQKRNI
jgi:hypothetical protein